MRFLGALLLAGALPLAAAAQTCDFKEYKPSEGLKAAMNQNALEVTWHGDHGQQLRASFAIRDGQPVVRELAARKGQGSWMILGRDLTPEFQVTSGVRRMSEQQAGPLRDLKIPITPEVIEKEKWNAFWDAPLMVPGTGYLGPKRTEAEIRRAWASYHATGCAVKSEGARLEITFPVSRWASSPVSCASPCIVGQTC